MPELKKKILNRKIFYVPMVIPIIYSIEFDFWRLKCILQRLFNISKLDISRCKNCLVERTRLFRFYENVSDEPLEVVDG